MYIRRKQAARRSLHARPRFYLLLAGLLALGFGLNLGLTGLRMGRLDARIAELTAQRQAQTEQLNALERELAYAQTDACVERIARSRLNLIYPGEIRYIAD